MRLLVLSDIDDFHWRWETGQADVVISCGDICDGLILEAAQAYGCATILAVKGNHDGATPFPPPIVDLHLKTVEVGGVRFGGFNGSWQYKPRGHFLHVQDAVRDALAGFPAVDIFIAHNSPRGIHDRDDDVHLGFEAFTGYIARARPLLLLHGHQHVSRETMWEGTKVVGVLGHRVLEVDDRS